MRLRDACISLHFFNSIILIATFSTFYDQYYIAKRQLKIQYNRTFNCLLKYWIFSTPECPFTTILSSKNKRLTRISRMNNRRGYSRWWSNPCKNRSYYSTTSPKTNLLNLQYLYSKFQHDFFTQCAKSSFW